MANNRKNLYWITIFWFVAFFDFICLEMLSATNPERLLMLMLSITTLTELCLFAFIGKKMLGTYVNYASCLYCILIIFNFGQVFILAFFETTAQELTIFLRYFSLEENFYAFKFIHYACSCLMLGTLLGQSRKLKQTRLDLSINYRKLIIGTLTVFILTFPIKAIIDIVVTFIGMALGTGAGGVWKSRIPDIVVSYGNLSIVCVCILIIANENSKIKFYVFMCAIMYTIFNMFGGHRSENVAYLFMYAFLYIRYSSFKLNTKLISKYIILGVLALCFIQTISFTKSYGNATFVGTLEAFWYVLTEDNFLIESLREFGNTGYTAECVILLWLSKYSPSGGMSYLGGLASIFPNIGGIFGKITHETGFMFSLQDKGTLDDNYINIGGSMIGELFFNFGLLGGLIAALILGYIIGRMNRKIEYCIGVRSNDIFYLLAVMPAFIYWVRDYFGGMTREMVWGMVMCWIILKYAKRKSFIQSNTNLCTAT